MAKKTTTKKTAAKKAPAKKATKRASPATTAVKLDLSGAGAALPPTEYLPTRNDVLNAFLGGGLTMGAVNEIAGRPGMFKTTILCEIAVDIVNEVHSIMKGGYAILFDREGRISQERFSSLGGPAEKHPRLVLKKNDPKLLTVEQVFRYASELVAKIRRNDLELLKDRIVKADCPPEVIEYYRHAVEAKPKTKARDIAKQLGEHWPYLRREDRSVIFVGIDSVTSMPTETVVGGKKSKKENEETAELRRRETYGSSSQPGNEARSWSANFRSQTWLDERVCVLCVAQMRMKGLMSQIGAWEAPAVPVAHEFYGRARLLSRRMEQGALYAGPDGSILLGNRSGLTSSDKMHEIGARLHVYVKKSIHGVLTPVPAFMLAARGTDRVNTYFEWLHQNKLVQAAGAYFTLNADLIAGSGVTLELGNFNRTKFITDLYLRHLDEWARLLRWFVATKVSPHG